MFITARIQTSVIHAFWSLATHTIGMRRLGDSLKRWYPSAYGDSIFYFDHDQHVLEESSSASNGGCIALTIDDGLFRVDSNDDDHNHDESLLQQQSSSMIQEVCDLLRAYEAHATFFVCTDYTTQQQAQKILSEGHEIGNHLKEDRSGYYSRLKEDDFARELDETNQILEAMLIKAQEQHQEQEPAQNRITCFRAPQGVMSRAMCKVLRDRKITNVMGDCYCDDWAFAEKVQSTSGVVAPLMLRQVRAGSIAIFHMPQRNFRESTLDALREFLEGLKQRNLRCVTVSTMMGKAST